MSEEFTVWDKDKPSETSEITEGDAKEAALCFVKKRDKDEDMYLIAVDGELFVDVCVKGSDGKVSEFRIYRWLDPVYLAKEVTTA